MPDTDPVPDFSYRLSSEGYRRNFFVDTRREGSLLVQFPDASDHVVMHGDVAEGVFLADFLACVETLFEQLEEAGKKTDPINRLIVPPVLRGPVVMLANKEGSKASNLVGERKPEMVRGIKRPISIEALEAEEYDVTNIGMIRFDSNGFSLFYMPEDGKVSAGFCLDDNTDSPIFEFLATMHLPELENSSQILSRFVIGLSQIE